MEETSCNICGDDLSEQTELKLKCKHKYHYGCLLLSLQGKMVGKRLRVTERCCPYCRTRIPLLPHKVGYGEHIPSIHTTLAIQAATKTGVAIVTCTATCKSGQPCKFKGKFNGMCGHHKEN